MSGDVVTLQKLCFGLDQVQVISLELHLSFVGVVQRLAQRDPSPSLGLLSAALYSV